MKSLRSTIVVFPCLAFSHIAAAQAGPRVSMDVSVAGVVSTNPVLEAKDVLTSNDQTDAGVTFSIGPRVYFDDGKGRTTIDGSLSLSKYSKRSELEELAKVGVSTNRQISEHTSLNASVAYQISQSAMQTTWFLSPDTLLGATNQAPGETNQPPQLPNVDTSIAGSRARRSSLSGSLGLAFKLDTRSSFSVSGTFADSTFEVGHGYDNRNFSGGLSYQRKLSERSTLTVGATTSYANYSDSNFGNTLIVSPTIGIQHQLSSSFSLNVAAGISYTHPLSDQGGAKDRVFVVGNLSLCTRGLGLRRNLCLVAQRSSSSTALQGVSKATSVGLQFHTNLSEHDQLSLSAQYAKRSQDNNYNVDNFIRNSQLFAGSVGYSRSLSKRLQFHVETTYARIKNDATYNRSNFTASLGIRLKIGTLR